jgi:hypothetical protein
MAQVEQGNGTAAYTGGDAQEHSGDLEDDEYIDWETEGLVVVLVWISTQDSKGWWSLLGRTCSLSGKPVRSFFQLQIPHAQLD